MAEVEELSQTTTELLEKAVRESAKLSKGDSLDRVLAHLARTYLIANMHSEELADLEEASDLAAEKRAELHDKRHSGKSENRASGATASRDARLSTLRERAQGAYRAEGVRHDGEGLTVGEHLSLRDRAREQVGLPREVNKE